MEIRLKTIFGLLKFERGINFIRNFLRTPLGKNYLINGVRPPWFIKELLGRPIVYYSWVLKNSPTGVLN